MSPQQHVDLTGQVFARWTVLREVPHEAGEKRRWLCRCTCGIQGEVRMDHLLSGQSASCGRRHGDDDLPRDLPLKTTTAAEALRQHHDTHSPLGQVRRVFRSVADDDEVSQHRADFDPFDMNPID